MADDRLTLKARLDAAEKEHAEANAELSRASSRAAKARKAYQKALSAYVDFMERGNETRTKAG